MKLENIANWKNWGKNQWLLILLAGILFVCIALPTKKETDKKGDAAPTVTVEGTDWENYRKDIEERLETMLANVEGVGKVQVMVTLADNGELVVEKDVPQTQSTVDESDSNGGNRKTKESTWQESTVYLEQNGESVPYVVKEMVPDIEGICVICQGGGDGTVAKNISEAVQALFSIEIHKIKVMKMK